MDPAQQPAHPRSLIRIHAVRLENPTTSRETDSEQHGSCGGTGWSGSMLVANPLCYFCYGAAQIYCKNNNVITNKKNKKSKTAINCKPLFSGVQSECAHSR
jgi:hypothetical protein